MDLGTGNSGASDTTDFGSGVATFSEQTLHELDTNTAILDLNDAQINTDPHFGTGSGRTYENLPSTAISELSAELPMANFHLRNYPFIAPQNVENAVLQYEGSFDPFGPHHMEILQAGIDLGFKSVMLGLCHQNPLKPQSTPFEYRLEMALEWLKSRGIPIAERYGEPGVYIETNPELFQFRKVVGWYKKEQYHLMGPDNFELYYNKNQCWTHVPEIMGTEAGRTDFGFRRMYREVDGFKETVLVYPRLHDLHSTNIREGFFAVHSNPQSSQSHPVAAMLPQGVIQVVTDRNLYNNPPAPKVAIGDPGIGVNSTSSVDSQVAAREQSLSAIKKVVQSAFGDTVVEGIMPVITDAISGLDRSELRALKNLITQGLSSGLESQAAAAQTRVIPGVRRVFNSVMSHMIGSNVKVTGLNEVHDLLEQGKKPVFVAAVRGSLEIGMMNYALAATGNRAFANQTNYVQWHSVLGDNFEKILMGSSVNQLNLGVTPTGTPKNVFTNSDRVCQVIAQGDFPVIVKSSASTGDTSDLNGLREDLYEVLNSNSQAEFGLNSEEIIVVPVEFIGAEGAFDENPNDLFWTSEDLPYVVNFKSPISLGEIEGSN